MGVQIADFHYYYFNLPLPAGRDWEILFPLPAGRDWEISVVTPLITYSGPAVESSPDDSFIESFVQHIENCTR